jgi:hypothetical protein
VWKIWSSVSILYQQIPDGFTDPGISYLLKNVVINEIHSIITLQCKAKLEKYFTLVKKTKTVHIMIGWLVRIVLWGGFHTLPIPEKREKTK